MDICVIEKGKNHQITKNFNQREIDCHCMVCYYTFYQVPFLEKVEKLRTSCGNKPIGVNSGCRCLFHNRYVGGVDNSKHTLGLAIDLEPPKGMLLDEFYHRALGVGFDTVIKYVDDNFIHCHDNP